MIAIIKSGVFAGLAGTLMMDLGSALLRASGLTQGLRPQLIQRWFGHVFHGRVVHPDIAVAAEVAFPMPLVLLVHYAIGITLGLTGVALHHALAQPRPVWPFALGFGALTNVFPWLLMFPAMGYGFFGQSAPGDWLLLRSSFLNHVLYGVGFGIVLSLTK
jgi:hypothetical protein